MFYAMLSMSLKYVLVYIWLSSSSGSGRSIDDQLLDLALTTNYSQSTFMLLARCQYLHRFNIARVGHRTILYFVHIKRWHRFKSLLEHVRFSLFLPLSLSLPPLSRVLVLGAYSSIERDSVSLREDVKRRERRKRTRFTPDVFAT